MFLLSVKTSAMAWGLLIGVAAVGAAGASAVAQETNPAAPVGAEQMATPRKAYRTFLERMARDEKKQAAEVLDLTGLNSEATAVKGPELAYKLYSVLKQLVQTPGGAPWPPEQEALYEQIPDEPDHPKAWSPYELGRYPDKRARMVELVRSAEGVWRFSPRTVGQLDELFLSVEAAPATFASADQEDQRVSEPFAVWFARRFPEPLRRTRFLLPHYQWLCLIVIAVVGRVVGVVVRTVLTRSGDVVLRLIDRDFPETTVKVWRPVAQLANAAIWYLGASVIGLPISAVGVLLVVLKLATIMAAVLSVYRLIDLIASYFLRRAKRTERRFDDLFIPLAATTTKVAITLGGVLAAVAAFSNTLPSTLLGGLGIGGVALALASQETLSNFFGSVTVLFDRPFELGDWVVVDGVEGEVESVGFRSTRIRTGLNSQVTVPNSKLAAAHIDNWGRRRYRRYLTRIGLEYGTTREQMDAFCEGVRELIRRQPHTRKDFYAAYFNEFGASSLEVLLVVFFEVSDWPTELRERHRLLSDIVELAERIGVGFAFPTQTLHLHQAEPTPPAKPIRDPEQQGQHLAARIAGELPDYQDRPGKVTFPGPADIDTFPPTPRRHRGISD